MTTNAGIQQVQAEELENGGETAMVAGDTIIWLSLFFGVVGAVLFSWPAIKANGSVVGPERFVALVSAGACVAGALNGAFFGFLLKQIGRVQLFLGQRHMTPPSNVSAE
jgi:drug/metabolite transporter (DMT)-like permease